MNKSPPFPPRRNFDDLVLLILSNGLTWVFAFLLINALDWVMILYFKGAFVCTFDCR